MAFKPEEHLIDFMGKRYLPVAARLVWFREDHPDWSIQTNIAERGNGWAVMKATIFDDRAVALSSAHKAETKKNFHDYLEKAETGAVGRALAMCGYGTQFAPELVEGERIVDAPQVVSSSVTVNYPGDKGSATSKQRNYIFSLGAGLGLTDTGVHQKAKVKFGLESFKDLTKDQASEFIDELSNAEKVEKTPVEELSEPLKGLEEDINPDEIPF